jgi:hypothetical protein
VAFGIRINMNIATNKIFNVWVDVSTDHEPQLPLEMDTDYTISDDPIAILIQYLGAQPSNWYDKTYLFSEVKERLKYNSTVSIEPFAREWSEKIRSYYKNKYFINRFKNREVSQFQQTVEAIISQDHVIKENQFAPLFKLPYFYLEDVEVEKVIKDSESIKLKVPNIIDDDFTFVAKVKRFGKRDNRYVRFLLQNSKKQLLSIVITENNTSFPLWNCLYESSSSINYKGHVNTSKFKGTDFYFYNVDNSVYKVRINKT